MRLDLRLGDCLAVLRALPAESVDSLVTDPPYGLSTEPDIAEVLTHWLAGDRYQHSGGGFMGKTWDSFVPGPEYWREVLRVLKPGAHGAVFAGSRTVDLMGIALRLGGFEVRDTIEWVYGTGFPKSLAIDKAIDKAHNRDASGVLVFRGNLDEVYRCTGLLAEARDAAGKSNREIDEAMGRNGMAGHWTARRSNSQPQIPTIEDWATLRGFLGVAEGSHLDALVHVLNGRKGEPGEGWTSREVTGEHTRPPAPEIFSQNLGEKVAVIGDKRDEPHTEAARAWRGWGTALKPAHEPIIIVRKPFRGTIASNVLLHGTGAINVDACRIGDEVRFNPPAANKPGGAALELSVRGMPAEAEGSTVEGRWPANLILGHSPGCVTAEVFDAMARDLAAGGATESEIAATLAEVGAEECASDCPVKLVNAQSGTSKSTATPRHHAAFASTSKGWERARVTGGHADAGGASRFFAVFGYSPADDLPFYYCAKPSRRERDLGCEDLPAASGGGATDREDGTDGLNSPRAGAGRSGGSRNIHPTVKPIAVMGWLARLLTPPGGTLIDPFAGSGSTPAAAAREGFSVIAVEMDPVYFEIMRRRVAAALPGATAPHASAELAALLALAGGQRRYLERLDAAHALPPAPGPLALLDVPPL